MDNLSEHGPPEHAWNMVAPGTAEQQARDQEDLDANSHLLGQHSSSLLQRYTMEAGKELLSPDEYRATMRGLNSKQRQVVMYHRAWCKRAVIAIKNGQAILPYRLFLSGPGGVEKSHVISLIRNDTVKLLRLSGQIQPEDVTVLLIQHQQELLPLIFKA